MMLLAVALVCIPPVLLEDGAEIPVTARYGFVGDPYRWLAYGESAAWPGNLGLTLRGGGAGPYDVPYLDFYGHSTFHQEIHAKDTIFIYGQNVGEAIQLYDVFGPNRVRVGRWSDRGVLNIGGGSPTEVAFAFLSDVDGSPTGWWKPVPNTWRFKREGWDLWDLTDNLTPLIDVHSTIGDASHRLLDVHTRKFTAESFAIVGADGVTPVGGFDTAGRFSIMGAGAWSAPGLAFRSQLDATPTGWFGDGDNWVFQRNNIRMAQFDGGGVSSWQHLYSYLGTRAQAWAQVAVRDVELVPQATLGTCSVAIAARVRAYVKGSTTSACVCTAESGVWAWRSMTPAGDCT